MGSACCTPVKHKELLTGTELDTPHSNVRCSPTLSIQWENRRRVAGEIEESSGHVPLRLDREYSEEIKAGLGSGRRNPYPCGSLPESFGTPFSLNSPVHEENFKDEAPNIPNTSIGSSYLMGLQNLAVSPEIAESSMPKISYSGNSSYSTPLHPTTACSHLLPPNSTPSRRARRSPGHRLLRQISDSKILGLKSPNSHSLSEGRPSFVLSMRSHDLAAGSSGSDGWSMRTFSELVASSQRGRWSFDGEQFDGSVGDKTSGCSSRFSSSPSLAPHACSSCAKLLNDASPWRGQVVVAVLDCGHVYHAECLEATTSEIDKYDPVCPACTSGEKLVLQKIAKVSLRPPALRKGKGHKISRNRVVDSSIDSDSNSVCERERESERRAYGSSGTSSSSKMSFLRRHFSLGSKWNSSASSSKKGFWPRQRK